MVGHCQGPCQNSGGIRDCSFNASGLCCNDDVHDDDCQFNPKSTSGNDDEYMMNDDVKDQACC